MNFFLGWIELNELCEHPSINYLYGGRHSLLYSAVSIALQLIVSFSFFSFRFTRKHCNGVNNVVACWWCICEIKLSSYLSFSYLIYLCPFPYLIVFWLLCIVGRKMVVIQWSTVVMMKVVTQVMRWTRYYGLFSFFFIIKNKQLT